MAGRIWMVVGLLALGCGGGAAQAPEPEVPSEATESEPVSTPAEPEEAATDPAEPAESEPAEPAAAASNEALGPKELESVLQQLLDDPDLEQYLHLNKAGRLPLKIYGPDLPEKMKLHKGGYDVKIVDEPKSAKEAVLVLTKIERDGSQVRLRYRFDVEGIRGSALVFEKGGTWRLRSNRVIEK